MSAKKAPSDSWELNLLALIVGDNLDSDDYVEKIRLIREMSVWIESWTFLSDEESRVAAAIISLCFLRMDTMLLAVSSLLFHSGCLDIIATMDFALQIINPLPRYFIATKGKETTTFLLEYG